jgi:hypothetical protein
MYFIWSIVLVLVHSVFTCSDFQFWIHCSEFSWNSLQNEWNVSWIGPIFPCSVSSEATIFCWFSWLTQLLFEQTWLPIHKPSTSSVVGHSPTYLPMYRTYFLHNGLPRWNHFKNSAEVNPQLSHNRHTVDGVLVGVGSLWPCAPASLHQSNFPFLSLTTSGVVKSGCASYSWMTWHTLHHLRVLSQSHFGF